MKKNLKIFLAVVFAFFAGHSFCEDWYVCIGAYNNIIEAKGRAVFLTNNGIPCHPEELGDKDGEKMFRVFVSEKFDSQEDAMAHREALIASYNGKFPSIPNLFNPENLWITSITKKIITADPEKRIISIKDSSTGAPVADADVNIDSRWDVQTNEMGKAPLPDEVPDGEHILKVSRGEEYIPVTSTMNISDGEITTIPQVSIPKKSDYRRIQVVLEWGQYPYDLDSHVFVGNRHIYYSNKIYGNVDLDVDDTSSYGPETITIKEPSRDEVYRYYIYNYSDGGREYSDRLSNSGCKVSVYTDREFVKTFEIKPNQTGLWWHVFDLQNGNEIKVFDEVSNELGDY